jgi:hypothetical protein
MPVASSAAVKVQLLAAGAGASFSLPFFPRIDFEKNRFEGSNRVMPFA